MTTAFISEHSAEYVLVPKFVALLSRHFSKIVPVYFLAGREGSTISRNCDPFRPVRVINVFARRPKIDVLGQSSIYVNFNESLFEISQLSTSMGIPTFAGAPLVSSIMDFGFDAECVWFELTGINGDVLYEISLDGTVLNKYENTSAIEGPLTERDLIERVVEKSSPLSWHEAVESLRAIRRGTRPDENFWYRFGGGYHPFNLICLD